jgi:PAS domain S-box-containing protein
MMDNSQRLLTARVPWWRQIRTNLILFSVIIVTVTGLVVGQFAFSGQRGQIINQVVNQLESVGTLKQNQIQRWLNTGDLLLDSAVSDVGNYGLLVRAMGSPDDPNVIVSNPNYLLKTLLNVRTKAEVPFRELFLYSAAGRIISSSDETQIGKVVNLQPYFAPSLKDNHTQPPYYEVGTAELNMVITRPLKDSSGTVVGVLAGRLDISTLGKIMTENANLGNTGETYLVSIENNYLLTPSRFEGFSLTRAYHSFGIDQALSSKQASGIYNDYRGVSVIGAYRWIPELRAGFLAEQEEGEALDAYFKVAALDTIIALVAILIAAAIAFWYATRLARPITALTQTAARVAGGDLNQRAETSANNEVGILAQTFNSMTDQLRDLIGGLEDRVAERTKDLATTIEVGQLATSIYSQTELLPKLVEFIRARFDLYYTQIYLLDEAQRYAKLTAGTGEVGQQLLARQHRLDLSETSLVARAVQTGQPVLVADTAVSDIHKKNPLLPDTRSEVTIPLIVGDQILGVLDMQADQADTFNEDNLTVFQAMAGQVAASLRGAQAYDEAQEATARAEAINQRLTANAWESYLGKLTRGGHVGYQFDLEKVEPVEPAPNDNGEEINASTATKDHVVQPIMLRGQTIGKIAVREDDSQHELGLEDQVLIEDVSKRVAAALEQFRAFDETQSALQQTEILYAGSDVINRANSFEEVINALVENTALKRLDRFSFSFFDRPWVETHPDTMTITGLWTKTDTPDNPAPVGTVLNLNLYPILDRFHRDEPFIATNLETDPRIDPNTRTLLVDRLGMHSLVALSLVAGGEWIGMYTGQATTVKPLTEDEIRQISALTDQASTKIQSIRSLQQTQVALQQTETLYAGSERVNQATTFAEVINALVSGTVLNHMDRFSLLFFDRPWIDTPPDTFQSVATWTRIPEVNPAAQGAVFPLSQFPVAQFFRADAPFIASDMETDTRVDADTRALLVGSLGMHSLVVLPMVAGGEWIGMYVAQSATPSRLSDDEIRQINALADQASTKIQSIRAFQQTQTALQQTETLYAGSERVNQSSHIEEVLHALIDNTRLKELDRVNFLMFDRPWTDVMPTTMTVEALWQSDGGTSISPVGSTYQMQNFPFLKFVHRDEPFVAVDVTTDERVDENTRALLQQLGNRSVSIFPMVAGDEWIGILSGQAQASLTLGTDDIRQLSNITSQAATKVQSLRLLQQTQQRAAQLETVAQVSAAAANILDLDELLQTVVDLTKASFDLYHAHIYLLDEAGKNLVLAAGAGEPGRIMKAEKRGIALSNPNSLVARAAREGTDIISNDVTQAPDFLPNPLLPDTRSELAVPMVVGDNLIGVLDIQANVANRFTDEDARIQTTLADQIAVAVQNARSFEETQARLRDVETTSKLSELVRSGDDLESIIERTIELLCQTFDAQNGVMSYFDHDQQMWRGFAGAGEGMTSEAAKTFVDPARAYPHGLEAIQTGQIVAVDNAHLYPEFPEFYIETLGIKSVLVLPILSGQTAIGVIFLNHNQTLHPYAPEEINLARTLSNQISTAIERKQAEEAIKLYVDVVNNTPSGVYVWRLDDVNDAKSLRLVVANTASQTATGVAPEMVVGRRMADAFPALMETELPNIYADVARSGNKTVPLGEIRYSDERVPESIFDVKAFSLPNQSMAVTFENITIRKQQEEELRRSIKEVQDVRFAIDQHSIVAITDQRGIINYANDKFTEISKYSREELLGQDHRIINSGYHSKEFIRDLWVTIANGEVWKGEIKNKAKDGSYYWVDTTLVPFLNDQGKPYQYVAIRSDISARKQQEEERQILLESANRLNNARTPKDIIETISVYTAERNMASATLMYIDSAADGTPEWAEVVALSAQNEVVSTTPVGTRFYLPEFALSKLWMSNPAEPLLIDDVQTNPLIDPVTRSVLARGTSQALAILPLYAQNRWVGLMTCSWNTPVKFDEQDKRIYQSFIRQATPSIDALRAASATQKRAAELQTVAEVSAAASSILDIDVLLQRVTELTKTRFDLYHAHVYLMDEAGNNLVLAAGAGEAGSIMKSEGRSISLKHPNSLVARAGREHHGVIVNDVTESPDFLPNPLLPDTKSELAVPMIVGDELIGVLDVQSDKVNYFSEDELRIQRTLADQIAVAVKNARAFRVQQETAERLREVDRLKSQFLANMSHELRTPLNSIIGYAEVLLDGIDGDLSDEAVEDVEAIHGGGKHLLSIINDILDLAKIEAGQMFVERKATDLVKVSEEVVHSLQILIKDKGIYLNFEKEDDLPETFADPLRLRQIVYNLVNNAIKFTEKGGITIGIGKYNDNQLRVSVTDTGIGMTEQDLSVIFERFSQVDGSATRRAGGTGLGLAITRHLIHMHEGEIYVESKRGEGSTFWFTLPMFQPEKA